MEEKKAATKSGPGGNGEDGALVPGFEGPKSLPNPESLTLHPNPNPNREWVFQGLRGYHDAGPFALPRECAGTYTRVSLKVSIHTPHMYIYVYYTYVVYIYTSYVYYIYIHPS